MLDQNFNPTSVPTIVAPMTDNTVSFEQVVVLQPKRKWWLVILLSIFGILIIGGGVYAFLFTDLKNKLSLFNKPVENVSEVVNPEPVVENEVATSTIDVNLDTDGDGLHDVDEINIWGTNINSVDSDGDGYSDSDEVNNGYNPLGGGKINLVGFVTPQAAIDNFLLALDSQDVSMLKKSFYNSEIRDDFNEASPKDAQEFLIQWQSGLEKSKWHKMEIKVLGEPYQSRYVNDYFPDLPENNYLVEIEYLADGKKVGSERQLVLIKLEDGSWKLYGFD